MNIIERLKSKSYDPLRIYGDELVKTFNNIDGCSVSTWSYGNGLIKAKIQSMNAESEELDAMPIKRMVYGVDGMMVIFQPSQNEIDRHMEERFNEP